jgi:DHA2 family multidrug resistance protein
VATARQIRSPALARSNHIPREAFLIIATAGLAALLEMVDTSIVNVAVPTMMGNLGATLDEISWVVTGYIIANAIILPLAGWLAVRIGRRRYYVGCILIFTGASVACGFAPNLIVLVLCRIVQGLAGGALLPTSQGLMQEALPREQAGMASALYGMVIIVGPTIGPPLGGYLTDHFGWRSIFNINLPLGVLAAFMAMSFVKDHELDGEHRKSDVRSHPIDYVGLSLLVVAIGALQFMLERGQTDDWFDSGVIRACAVLSVAGTAGFIWWELRTRFPIVELHLFKVPNLRYGAIMMGAIGFILYGLIFFVPIFCATTLGLTATQTGILFIPGALMSGLMMPLVGVQIRKRDPRQLVILGLACVCVSLAMLAYSSPQTGQVEMFWPLFIRGVGMAFLFTPINAVVLGTFTGPQIGQVAGITNLFRQLGGSLGIAILSTLFTHNVRNAYSQMVGRISFLNPALRLGAPQLHATALELGMGTPAQVAGKVAYYRLQGQAFVIGFDHMMWVMAIFFSLALIPLYFLKAPAHLGPAEAH